MNKYKLYKAGINTTEGIGRFNGNAELYEKCLRNFLSDTNYTTLCDAIKSGDAKTAFTAAHSLKGVAGNLSLTEFYNDIIPLVEELRTENIGNSRELLAPVATDYEKIVSALNEATD